MEVKHPVKLTLAIGGVITTLNVMFSAGFVYSKLDQDWLELKRYKQKIDRLEKENDLILQSIKARDEHLFKLHDKIKECTAKKAVYSSHNF